MIKKILIFLGIQLLIGNVVSWYFGAWPIDFPRAEIPEDDPTVRFLRARIAEDASDYLAYKELGRFYGDANHLDDADEMLSRALELTSDDAELLALKASNDMKTAGAMFDPLMGLYKLSLTKQSVRDLAAIQMKDCEQVPARLVRYASLSRLGDIGGASPLVVEDARCFSMQLAEFNDASIVTEIVRSSCIAAENFGQDVEKYAGDICAEGTAKVARG